jgi:arylsulfatase A-like enzyme
VAPDPGVAPEGEPGLAKQRLNFLWLIAEDTSTPFGCYGQKGVSTPNIDRLAAEGVRYSRFYCTAPVCSPSRSAFMTGMYQTTIGAHHHRSHRDDGYRLPRGVRLLTERLRDDAGYFTANVVEMPDGFGFRGSGKTDWNFTPPDKPFDSDRWDDLKGHQPFLAQINFQETHRPFKGPRRADPAKISIPPYYPDHPVTREDYARYLDSAMGLDEKVGQVLSLLEKEGLVENTVVIFMGDNGEAHVRGKQFCYEEGLHVPLIIRWPKAAGPPPKGFRPGTTDDRLLESIDVTATLLSLADAPVPAQMQGKPFLGDHMAPAKRYVFGARDRCDETSMRHRTVRDGRYRYIRNFTPEKPFLSPNAYKAKQYPVWTLLSKLNAEGKLTPTQAALCAPTMPKEELYDLRDDPHEIRNLAEDPKHTAKLAELRSVLERWIIDTGDRGRIPEKRAPQAQP